MRKVCIGKDVASMAEAVRQAYAEGQEDELFEPIVTVDSLGRLSGKIREGECVIFYNIRGEREVQLTQALMDPDFNHFPRASGRPSRMATMIEYQEGLPAQVAFPPIGRVKNTLGEVLSKQGMRQVRVVESEKAIHVSYFLNGKAPDPFPLEDRVFVPSNREVQNFDELPEMSVSEVAETLVAKLREGNYRFVLGNFANVDVVGHMEDEAAVGKAIEAVDTHAGIVVEEAKKQGYVTLITSDHGTVETRLYPDGTIDTGHSDSQVPFLIIPPNGSAPIELRSGGSLVDVAPTILEILGIPMPEEMTGATLLKGPEKRLEEYHRLCEGEPRVFLLILDGWGYRPTEEGNLIAQTPTPTMDRLMKDYPWTLLDAAGMAVGMPEGSVGNSESGHLHLGAGRVIPSDRVRIDEAIRTGAFLENEAFRWAMAPCREDGKTLHLLGIVSFYSSHGSLDHLFALMEMAKREGLQRLYIHSLLGRRGEKPASGAIYVDKVEQKAKELGLGEVATVMGRYWALDREHNWDRIEKAYRALVGN
jgi:2,3-bisphosphoglycerate-independent phosphoglycerate mutase